jgi:hypothetical protein
MINTASYIIYFGVTLNAGDIGLGSLQLNVVFLCVVQIGSYVFTYFFIGTIKRRKGTLIVQLMFLVGGILLVLIHNVIPDFRGEKWVETMFVCVLIRGGMSFMFAIIFNMGAELFDSTVR